ncbi:hypothetical protein BC937DRAFT_93398 [Endogone sp. FLAS-F59071]|nr:hypothetical protein BC937DRAFT_93398 [Endogone sp. FLAS-F59071]|eukprot:RUS14746.1 hypothetical protein BC937DRAFT_93398 [Endogone sp. FLAS-F59071]
METHTLPLLPVSRRESQSRPPPILNCPSHTIIVVPPAVATPRTRHSYYSAIGYGVPDDYSDYELVPPSPSFPSPARVSSMNAFPAVHLHPPQPAPGFDFMGPKIQYLKKVAPQFNMRTANDDDMGYPKPQPPCRGTLVVDYNQTRLEVSISTDMSPLNLLHIVPHMVPGALEFNRTFYPLIPAMILPILSSTVSVLYRVHPTPTSSLPIDPVRLPYLATKDLPSFTFRLRVRDADEALHTPFSRLRTRQDPAQGRSFTCVVSLAMSGGMFADYLRAVSGKEVLEAILAEDQGFYMGMEQFDNAALIELYEAVSERGGRKMEPGSEIFGKDLPDDLMMPEFILEFVNLRQS